MKFGVVNKSTTVNRFVLHTLHRNITHLAVITRKTNIKSVFEFQFCKVFSSCHNVMKVFMVNNVTAVSFSAA